MSQTDREIERHRKDWKNYLEFLDGVVYDSPHSCDDQTMDWHEEKMRQLKAMILGEEPTIEQDTT